MVRCRGAVVLIVAVFGLVGSTVGRVGADSNEGRAGSVRGAESVISAGSNHSCALLANATVKCWGDGFYGQLGQGSTAKVGDTANEMGDNLLPIALGTGRTATAMSAGGSHTCALLDDGKVKCWGFGFGGELGQGSTSNIGNAPFQMGDNLASVALGTGRTATAISAGNFDTCALLDNGTVKCWGYNFYGELGQGSASNVGDAANQMGDNLPAISLGTGRTATAISTGDFHTCALLDNGTVKCWGDGVYGKLGQGSMSNVGDAPNEMGDNLAPVSLGAGRTATAISAGNDFSCALLDNATVKCWGSGLYGELGQGSMSNVGDQLNQMGDNLAAVALGSGRTVTAISAGSSHSCAMFDNATVKCWGYGLYGRLGQGNTTNIGGGPNQMGDFLPPVNLGAGRTATAVHVGSSDSCAVLDNSSVKCWGLGLFGQLGQGSTANVGDAPLQMAGLASIALGAGSGALVVGAVVAPAAPTGVSATAGVSSVVLSWTAPADSGGAAVIGYRIDVSIDNGLDWVTTVADSGSVATTRTLSGLSAGQPVTFRVAAINSHGAGVASSPSTPVTPTAPVVVPPPPAGGYVSLDPARLLDTRTDGVTIDGLFHTGIKLVAGQEIALQVTGRGGVPAGAVAVVLNVTVTDPQAAGYVTVYPCGTTRPNASNLNYTPGQTIPNNVIVKLGFNGTICIYTQQTTNLIGDINGAFS